MNGVLGIRNQCRRMESADVAARPWSSLVESDKPLDWPNSQMCMEYCHACVA